MKRLSIFATIPVCACLAFAQAETSGSATPQSSPQSTPTAQSSESTAQNKPSAAKNDSTITGILVASGCDASMTRNIWATDEKSASARSTSGSGYAAGSDMSRTTNATAGSAGSDTNRSMGATSSGGTANESTRPTVGDINRSTDAAATAANRNTRPADQSMNTPQTGMADRNRGGDTSATTGSRTTPTDMPASTASSSTTWSEADRANTNGQTADNGKGPGSWDHACFISPTTSAYVLLMKDGRQVRLDDSSNSLVQQRLSSANRVSDKSKIFRVRITGNMNGDTVHVEDIQM